MTITKQQIEARIVQLQNQREDILAQINACMGALQECDHWLAILMAPDPLEKSE